MPTRALHCIALHNHWEGDRPLQLSFNQSGQQITYFGTSKQEFFSESMSRTDLNFCIMTFHLSCLVFYLIICLHDSGARDWKRTSDKPWIKGYVRRRTIKITSTLDPITPSMAPIPSMADYCMSSSPEENIYSTPVIIVMALAIVAFSVGLFLTIKTMWNKHHNTASTQEDTSYRSSHDTPD